YDAFIPSRVLSLRGGNWSTTSCAKAPPARPRDRPRLRRPGGAAERSRGGPPQPLRGREILSWPVPGVISPGYSPTAPRGGKSPQPTAGTVCRPGAPVSPLIVRARPVPCPGGTLEHSRVVPPPDREAPPNPPALEGRRSAASAAPPG